MHASHFARKHNLTSVALSLPLSKRKHVLMFLHRFFHFITNQTTLNMFYLCIVLHNYQDYHIIRINRFDTFEQTRKYQNIIRKNRNGLFKKINRPVHGIIFYCTTKETL